MDFLVTREKKPCLLVEVKLSRTAPEKALHYFAEKPGVKHRFLVVAEQERPGQAADVHVLDAHCFLACLPV